LKTDDWGRDPQVQYIRRLFAGMETAQRAFLTALDLSPFDPRLGPWRQAALRLFETVWARAGRRHTALEEKDIVQIYLHSLAAVLSDQNMAIPEGLVSADETISRWIKEVRS
jgi:hypothetical protein